MLDVTSKEKNQFVTIGNLNKIYGWIDFKVKKKNDKVWYIGSRCQSHEIGRGFLLWIRYTEYDVLRCFSSFIFL